MSIKKDNKRRNLRQGEMQEKNGRYRYQCTHNGEKYCLYSWRLVETDPTPPGKKYDAALRTKIAELEKHFEEIIFSKEITVKELVEQYISFKERTLRPNTVNQYKKNLTTLMNTTKKHKNNIFNKKIYNILPIEIKNVMKDLEDDEHAYSTCKACHLLLKASYDMALENRWVTFNPCQFKLSNICDKSRVTKRNGISKEDMEDFLDFVKNNYSEYYVFCKLLFETGVRISEGCALTPDDFHFSTSKEEVSYFTVNKQLLYNKEEKKLYIEKPKTLDGTRNVPISNELAELIKQQFNTRKVPTGKEDIIEVDGISGFLEYVFNSSRRSYRPIFAKSWEQRYRTMREEYNNTHRIGKTPLMITPHVCRHTCTTQLYQSQVSLKSIQSIIGHRLTTEDIRNVTMDVYIDKDETYAMKEFCAKVLSDDYT